VDYLWEQRKREDKRTSRFTQIYDVILSRQLQPLYDASVKFEFRSETGEDDEDREKTQVLPALNMRFGNDILNTNLGWGKDTISEEKGTYTNEREFMGVGWRTQWLPNILLQVQEQKRERSWEENPAVKETWISLKEDYTLSLGLLTLDHNFNHNKRDTDGRLTSNYELINNGKIGHRFSFFEKRLDINTGYELSQRDERQEDGSHKDTWKHDFLGTITGYPVQWLRPEYNLYWEDIKTSQPDKRENSVGHSLNFLILPHRYLRSNIGMNYNRYDASEDPGPRDVIVYSLKLEPSLQGLLFDPNSTMYPLRTSLLLSSTTDRSEGERQNHTLSMLLTGFTTLYRGIDLDMDAGITQRQNFTDDSKRLEERLDTHLNLDLMPGLKSSVKQKAEWIQDRGEGYEGRTFNGDLETRIIYRPVETFLCDAAYTLDYGGEGDSYEFSIGWRPTSKLEFDVRYQSGDNNSSSFFSGEMDLKVSQTIRLNMRYQHPTTDQSIKLRLTIRF